MKILFLSTWFPYPLNQGSKIRGYHLLKALADQHDVALASFEDAELRPEWLDHIRSLCPVVETLPRKPFQTSRLKSVLGWLSPKPNTVTAIRSPEMSALARRMAQSWRPECIVALTYVTAPYALEAEGAVRVVDIDNVMTRMLYELVPLARSAPERFRRWLAYRKFLAYEKSLYPRFERALAVTENDRRDAQQWFGLEPQQLLVVPNGVETAAGDFQSYAPEPGALIFNGALTYSANYDAMEFFLGEIFPEVVRQAPEATLRITGSAAGVDLGRLAINDHVELTGYLDDVRPAVAQSWACVVPLRIGGGTRLKILEAMALGTPVICTSKGAEGLAAQNEVHLLIADDPHAFIEQTLRLLRSPDLRQRLSQNARRLMQEKYDWAAIEKDFCAQIEAIVSRN
ncbi:MAG: hypothetical protein B6D39_02380 [Anaerolineae bacterium UTCFX2]|jgi:glycosyltransferase involved in cell wall biosynthesis|nr:glycosyltransferase [Anaerolineae bacterium]MCZ7551920.1 glycosyltransferase family 4 protein [Anaerolineales bacterium]OQY93928.1 MAG: hypothetical protein B6D39_02380 [Anaerolineae bacterium UTCFX2]